MRSDTPLRTYLIFGLLGPYAGLVTVAVLDYPLRWLVWSYYFPDPWDRYFFAEPWRGYAWMLSVELRYGIFVAPYFGLLPALATCFALCRLERLRGGVSFGAVLLTATVVAVTFWLAHFSLGAYYYSPGSARAAWSPSHFLPSLINFMLIPSGVSAVVSWRIAKPKLFNNEAHA